MRTHFFRYAAIAAFGLLITACSEDSRTPSAPRATGDLPAHDPSACNLLIGDRVWNDLDADGCQDEDEPGIEGITVTLYDVESDDVVATARTDEDGWYRFEDLCPGAYRVEASCPDDCRPTTPEACARDRDSASSPATVLLGDCDDTIDFGFVCGKRDEGCGACDGKVSELTLRYTGESVAHVTVIQKHKDLVVFRGSVAPGQTFHFTGRDKKGTLGSEIRIFVDGEECARIHTSCSRPIGPGLVAGDFEIVAGRSRKGGPLCPLPSGGPGRRE